MKSVLLGVTTVFVCPSDVGVESAGEVVALLLNPDVGSVDNVRVGMLEELV